MDDNNWKSFFEKEKKEDYFKEIQIKLDSEYENYTIYPDKNNIFRAFQLTELEDIKVVILGQDPYHGPDQADGLSFSVKNKKIPPSLRNILKELENDYELKLLSDGNLESWAKQGVFLLNSGLTVRKNKANSHKDIGWSIFTDRVIKFINSKRKNLVYILWGNFAQEKSKFIDKENNLILKSSHPSPFSASISFFNSKPFTKTNNYLNKVNIDPINWLSIGQVIE